MSGIVDEEAIADAIAVRFSAANVTAPSGLQNIRVASAVLPDTISLFPTVLVFPPEEAYDYGPSRRLIEQLYPVRFYYSAPGDYGRVIDQLRQWRRALYGQLDGSAHLGLPNYVMWAAVSSSRIGELPGFGVDSANGWPGIDLTVTVHVSEGLTLTA